MLFYNIGNIYISEFKDYLRYSKEFKYLSDIDMYISSRVNGVKVKNIYCNENELKFEFINRENKKQVDTMRKKRDNLVIKYKKEYEPSTIEYTMLKSVENFEVYDKDNLFYVYIKQKNSEERIFCYEKS
ncbi:MAG: hypothetical protein ACRC7R_10895 [Sarcina sp.]